jgi:hypothetical protein
MSVKKIVTNSKIKDHRKVTWKGGDGVVPLREGNDDRIGCGVGGECQC